MMKRLFLMSTAFMAACLAGPASAQETAQKANVVNPLDDRGGLPVPENLHDLRNLSVTFWVKFRRTSQHLYRYVNETAQFHAYAHFCKRHELNLSIAPLTKLSHHYIQAAIPAHFDEPEFALLEPLSKKEQQDFLDDISGDIYNFEYGYRTAELQKIIDNSGKTKKQFCEGVEKEFKLSYMALRATANNRLPEYEDRQGLE